MARVRHYDDRRAEPSRLADSDCGGRSQAVSPPKRSQLLMYEQFFGLRERPFELVPNPRFLYLSARQQEAVGNLRLGLHTARGLTLLLGEAGTGKTTIVQAVLGALDPATVEYVLLSNPTLTRAEFYESLAEGFALSAQAAYSKARFLTDFRERLEARHAAGLLSALVLDEAQSMSHELLEEVRLLSNIETPTSKLLNVVLAGQPELADRLNDPNLRQLKQRVSLRCELATLNFAETAAYIAGRIRIAGGEPAAIFSREAILAIHQCSRGVPRTINVICDNALIGAYASQVRPIVRSIVDDVCHDFDFRPSAAQVAAPQSPAAAPEPAAAAGAAGADTTKGSAADSPPPPVPDASTKRFSFF